MCTVNIDPDAQQALVAVLVAMRNALADQYGCSPEDFTIGPVDLGTHCTPGEIQIRGQPPRTVARSGELHSQPHRPVPRVPREHRHDAITNRSRINP